MPAISVLGRKDGSIAPVHVPWEGGVWAEGGGSAGAKRTARKHHRLARKRVGAIRIAVSRAMPAPRPNGRITYLVRDFEHKALAQFVGRGDSIKRDQR